LALFVLFIIVKINFNYFYGCKGKFVFDSVRDRDGIYVYENGNIRFITNKASFPRWSPDGTKILALNYRGIVLINAMTKKIDREIIFPYGQIIEIAWLNDGQSIVYALKVRKNDLFDFFIVKQNLINNRKEILYKFLFKKIDFSVSNLVISPNDQFIAFFAGSNSMNSYMYFLDIQFGIIKYLWQAAYPIGWMPNNKDLVFFATKDRLGNTVEEALGQISKIDVLTGRVITIDPFSFIDSQEIRMTKDGRYLYYSKRSSENGFEIVYSKFGQGKISSEIRVTKLEFINNSKGYSKDLEPDWYL
jgi:hypothetical protein